MESNEWIRGSLKNWKDNAPLPLGGFVLRSMLIFIFWCLAYLLLETVPLPTQDLYPIRPVLMLIPIYYWTFHRPEHVSPLLIVAAGLVRDIVVGTLLGVSPACFSRLLLGRILHSRVVLGRNFVNIWVRFSLTSLVAYGVIWAALWIGGSPAPAGHSDCCIHVVLTATYPVATLLFDLVHARHHRRNRLMYRDRSTDAAHVCGLQDHTFR